MDHGANSARAIIAGPHAARALKAGARGHVHSIFERSLYVLLGEQLICIGPTGLGGGPLNLICDPFIPRGEPAKRLRIGDAVRVDGNWLNIGAMLAIDLGETGTWRPANVSLAGNIAVKLEDFDQALPALPTEGLARIMLSGYIEHSAPYLRTAPNPHPEEHGKAVRLEGSRPPIVSEHGLSSSFETVPSGPPQDEGGSRELRAARIPAQALASFVRGEMATAPSELIALLGLGPGLTPSGDDFLGGAMIALTALNQTAKRDAIWKLLRPALSERTTDISAAHLNAAAEGLGNIALHAFLAALFDADTKNLRPRIDDLAAIGHTSGLDALAGAITVLRAHKL